MKPLPAPFLRTRPLLALLVAITVFACTSSEDASPSPTPSPALVSTTATPSRSPTTTATPSLSPTTRATRSLSTPLPTSTPTPPVIRQPDDFLAALASRAIEVQPTGRTFTCDEVDGLPGTEYAGDATFVLWAYPSSGAAEREWIIQPYDARHIVPRCNAPPALVYPLDNLILSVRVTDLFDPLARSVADVFLSLPGQPLPSELHGAVIVDPAAGAPLSAADFLDALNENVGLTYTPYMSLLCASDVEGLTTTLVGPRPGQGSESLLSLSVYPSSEAVDDEWTSEDGETYEWSAARPRPCDWIVGDVYRNQNLLLVVRTDIPDEQRRRTIDTFLALTP